VLNDAGLGTLLFDLLTSEEERDRANVFDIGLLAGRLVQVSGWLRGQPGVGARADRIFVLHRRVHGREWVDRGRSSGSAAPAGLSKLGCRGRFGRDAARFHATCSTSRT
jgi:hypothetical protein